MRSTSPAAGQGGRKCPRRARTAELPASAGSEGEGAANSRRAAPAPRPLSAAPVHRSLRRRNAGLGPLGSPAAPASKSESAVRLARQRGEPSTPPHAPCSAAAGKRNRRRGPLRSADRRRVNPSHALLVCRAEAGRTLPPRRSRSALRPPRRRTARQNAGTARVRTGVARFWAIHTRLKEISCEPRGTAKTPGACARCEPGTQHRLTRRTFDKWLRLDRQLMWR